jgi:PEGA domain
VAVLKIARLWPSVKRRDIGTVVPLDDSFGLDAFASEAGPAVATRSGSSAPRKAPPIAARPTVATKWWVVALYAIALVGLGTGVYALRNHPLAWGARTGSVTFDTVPAGVDVFVGEKSIGRTPTTVALAPGTYDVSLGSGPQARPLKVTVTAGTSFVQHYEMAAPAMVPATGGLRIQSEPANLPVLFDGVEKGLSPVVIERVEPGAHDVAVRRDQSVIKQVVHVIAGENTSVIISSAAPKPEAGLVTAGWLLATAPISLKVKEGGRLIGTTDLDKLMLSSGDHDLEFSNEALGFHVTRRVSISAGKTTASFIALPNGSLSLNALPWADVYVDGNHIGQTPLGNLSLPIGTHEVVFRHPDLGERKETVTVSTSAPARLGVDLRKK